MRNCPGTIYVVSHKFAKIPKRNGYKGIAVGPLSLNPPKGFLCDCIGTNISNKNSSYCELTAVYWIWKNDAESDFVGINHYSRLFAHPSDERMILGVEEASQLLQDYDLIVPQKQCWDRSVANYYYECGMGRSKDLSITESVLKKLYPDYHAAFRTVMERKSAFYCNMLIANRSLFCEYCEWLFPILQAVEDSIDTTGYSAAEKRVIGYLSELLLNVWVENNAYSYIELSIIKPKRSAKERMHGKFGRLFRK